MAIQVARRAANPALESRADTATDADAVARESWLSTYRQLFAAYPLQTTLSLFPLAALLIVVLAIALP